MHILCDTGSILMVIRIAPEMFTDPRYECKTISQVKEEIFTTRKFKDKYPWRDKYKNKIIAMGTTELNTANFQLYLSAINQLINNGKVSQTTGKLFDLSRVDKTVAASALAHNCAITTTDNALIDFMKQEFTTENITPLGLINEWLREGLIAWNTEKQGIIEDWERCRELIQQAEDIQEFERITGYDYPAT
jgi:hypothetical protein